MYVLQEIYKEGGLAMKMKYDSKVLKAIEGSIDKWIGIAYEGKEDGGTKDCCLCHIFNSAITGHKYCDGCPIQVVTGQFECYGTPYPECDTYDILIQMLDYLLHLAQWYELTAERV